MAEIRKHKPANDSIARALAAAMGEPVRPVEPGSTQGESGSSDDPERETDDAAADSAHDPAHDTAVTFTVRPGRHGAGEGLDDESPRRSE